MKDHLVFVKIQEVRYSGKKYVLGDDSITVKNRRGSQREQGPERPGKWTLNSTELDGETVHVGSKIIFRMIMTCRTGGVSGGGGTGLESLPDLGGNNDFAPDVSSEV